MANFWDPQVVGNYPAYAPAGSGKTYSSDSNVFNANPNNIYNIRAALDKAADGTGQCHIACVPLESLSIGYNGNGGYNINYAVPVVMREYLNTAGYPRGGPGTMVTAISGAINPGGYGFTAWTGSMAPYNFFMYGATGGTVTWVSPYPCTNVMISTNNQSGNWSYTVDGGASNNVVPTGANSVNNVTITGLSNAAHTIVITSATAHVLYAISGYGNGVNVHNLAMGGSTMAYAAGGPNTNWGDTSSPTSLSGARLACLPGGPSAMHGVFAMIGTNDIIFNGVAPATVASGLESYLLTNFPGINAGTTDVILGYSYHTPPVNAANDANWFTYGNLLYQLAIKHNWRLIDWNARLGGVGQAVTNGLIASDNVHAIYGPQLNFGKALGFALSI